MRILYPLCIDQRKTETEDVIIWKILKLNVELICKKLGQCFDCSSSMFLDTICHIFLSLSRFFISYLFYDYIHTFTQIYSRLIISYCSYRGVDTDFVCKRLCKAIACIPNVNRVSFEKSCYFHRRTFSRSSKHNTKRIRC